MIEQIVVLFGPAVAFAAATAAAETNVIHDYPAAAATIIIVFASIIGFFFVRTLKQIDKSQSRTTEIQDKLFAKLDNLSEDFYTLKGEHRVMHQGGVDNES